MSNNLFICIFPAGGYDGWLYEQIKAEDFQKLLTLKSYEVNMDKSM